MAEVDTTIPAQATGAAAKLAAAHSPEHPLKLYAGWFCPFVQRAWIVLREKRIPHQYIEINPYHKSPEFLALNPRGLVPTLAVPRETPSSPSSSSAGAAAAGGKEAPQLKPLYESSILCEYLDEVSVDEALFGPRLLPADPYERARCRIWIDHISGKVVAGFYRLLQHTPEKGYSIDEARAEFHNHIRALVQEMAPSSGGPWFLGERFSLVDVCLAPWAKRLWLIDHYKPGGVGIPRLGQAGDGGRGDTEEAAIWGRWQVWFDAIVNRDSVKGTWSDDGEYIKVYKRYAEDTTNSLVGQATRKGEKLP